MKLLKGKARIWWFVSVGYKMLMEQIMYVCLTVALMKYVLFFNSTCIENISMSKDRRSLDHSYLFFFFFFFFLRRIWRKYNSTLLFPLWISSISYVFPLSQLLCKHGCSQMCSQMWITQSRRVVIHSYSVSYLHGSPLQPCLLEISKA
jgi:hypothetical protein